MFVLTLYGWTVRVSIIYDRNSSAQFFLGAPLFSSFFIYLFYFLLLLLFLHKWKVKALAFPMIPKSMGVSSQSVGLNRCRNFLFQSTDNVAIQLHVRVVSKSSRCLFLPLCIMANRRNLSHMDADEALQKLMDWRSDGESWDDLLDYSEEEFSDDDVSDVDNSDKNFILDDSIVNESDHDDEEETVPTGRGRGCGYGARRGLSSQRGRTRGCRGMPSQSDRFSHRQFGNIPYSDFDIYFS